MPTTCAAPTPKWTRRPAETMSVRTLEPRDVDAVLAIQSACPEIAQWSRADYDRSHTGELLGWVAERIAGSDSPRSIRRRFSRRPSHRSRNRNSQFRRSRPNLAITESAPICSTPPSTGPARQVSPKPCSKSLRQRRRPPPLPPPQFSNRRPPPPLLLLTFRRRPPPHRPPHLTLHTSRPARGTGIRACGLRHSCRRQV